MLSCVALCCLSLHQLLRCDTIWLPVSLHHSFRISKMLDCKCFEAKQTWYKLAFRKAAFLCFWITERNIQANKIEYFGLILSISDRRWNCIRVTSLYILFYFFRSQWFLMSCKTFVLFSIYKVTFCANITSVVFLLKELPFKITANFLILYLVDLLSSSALRGMASVSVANLECLLLCFTPLFPFIDELFLQLFLLCSSYSSPPHLFCVHTFHFIFQFQSHTSMPLCYLHPPHLFPSLLPKPTFSSHIIRSLIANSFVSCTR